MTGISLGSVDGAARALAREGYLADRPLALAVHRLNPLAAHPGFEPLTRGMRAAVPHTDELLPLEDLASVLEEI